MWKVENGGYGKGLVTVGFKSEKKSIDRVDWRCSSRIDKEKLGVTNPNPNYTFATITNILIRPSTNNTLSALPSQRHRSQIQRNPFTISLDKRKAATLPFYSQRHPSPHYHNPNRQNNLTPRTSNSYPFSRY